MEDNKKITPEEEAAEVETTETECGAPAEEEVAETTESACEEEKTCRGDKKKLKKAEAEIAELKKALEQKEAALAEENEKYLRLCAEYDNFRKRSAKEREGIYNDAYSEALASLFPVVDNLERAAQYSDGENVAKGVAMTLKSVKDTLDKLGVSEIDPTGCEFDPNLHNAVMHVEDESLGENIVVEVLQKGYCRGERVLRYAMVKVAN